MKKCWACQIEKSDTEFSRSKTSFDGLNPKCRRCAAEYYIRKKQEANVCCSDCGKQIQRTSQTGKCASCVKYRGGNRYIDARGYVCLCDRKYMGHPNAYYSSDGPPRIMEHTLVISEHLGRGLVKGESVHHRNGNRSDNRLENLELWSKSQPAGQRIEDKLDWAREILEVYKDYKPLETL